MILSNKSGLTNELTGVKNRSNGKIRMVCYATNPQCVVDDHAIEVLRSSAPPAIEIGHSAFGRSIMLWYTRIALNLAACLAFVTAVVGQEPPAKPKAKVEFRWLEKRPIQDVTEDKGIPITCGGELAYLHKTPILFGNDVTKAHLRKHDFTVGGLPFDLFSIQFDVTDEAKLKLAAASGGERLKLVAIVVDGKYLGASYFKADKITEFAPSAGFISSRIEAERIVESCQ
jgi:hypothetical protein